MTSPLSPPKIQTTLQDPETVTPSQSLEADTSLLTAPSSPINQREGERERSTSPIGTRITPVRSNSTSSRFHEHISSGESEGENEAAKGKEEDLVQQQQQQQQQSESSPTRRMSIGLGGLSRALSSKSKSGKSSRPVQSTRSTTADTNFSAVTALETPLINEDRNGNQVQLAPTILNQHDDHHHDGKELVSKSQRKSDSSWERIEVPSNEEMLNNPIQDSQSKKGKKTKSKSKSIGNDDQVQQQPNLNADLVKKSKDPLREPRRNIKKRPIEFKTGQAIGAPILRSGVVLDNPPTFRDWIPSPVGLNSLQGAYLLIAHCFGAAIISGAINFGIGVATYINQPAVHIWIFNPITLAGDMGLTVILQQMITMLITSSMVHKDLADGPIIGSLRKPWPPLLHLPSTPSQTGNFFGFKTTSEVSEMKLSPLKMGKAENQSKFKTWFYFILRSVFTGSEKNDILATGITGKKRFQRILWTAAQGLVLSAFTFWWYWPISIAIVAPLYEHREHVLVHSYIAPIVKLLFGGILGLLTNPIFALMAMGAEFNVRRCYPELEIWREFGGEEDTREWRREMGLQDQEGVKEQA